MNILAEIETNNLEHQQQINLLYDTVLHIDYGPIDFGWVVRDIRLSGIIAF